MTLSFSCKDYTFDNLVDTNNKIITPTGLTVSFSADTMATVTWQHNLASKFNYVIDLSADETNWSRFGEVSNANTITAKYNFMVAKNYGFRVSALSDQNKSSYVTAQAQITTLNAPSELTISFPTDTKAVLTWKDNSTIETGFEIEMSSDGINYTIAKTVGANSTTIDIDGTYLTTVNYSFRMRAKSKINYSALSNTAQSKPGFNAPSNLQVSFPNDTKATLTWTDNSSYETGFEIEMSSDGVNYAIASSISSNVTSADVAYNYLTSVNYSFRVRAKTANNYSNYSSIGQGKPVVNAPSNLQVSFPNDTRVTLTWKDNCNFETGFDIEMSSDGVNYALANTFASNVTSTDISFNYQPGISYSFRVRAKTANNYSSYSNIVTTGIKSPIPILLSPLSGAIDQSLTPTLNWNASAGSKSYTLQVSINNSFSSYFYNKDVGNVTTFQLTGLSRSTTYYWRVSATNSNGTSNFSTPTWSFTTINLCPTSTVTYSGKTYNTVAIGSQCWLEENLDVGTRINGSSEQTNNSTIEKYCYNDDINNCTKYGGLYQWAEAVQYKNGATNTTSPSPAFSGNVQGICPSGWHVPTNAEFQTLGTSVNNDGNALKRIDQGTGSGVGTNTSGFSALLAGCRNYNSNFLNLGYSTYFWSSTESSATIAYYLNLYDNYSVISFYNYNKDYGYSVRCLKD